MLISLFSWQQLSGWCVIHSGSSLYASIKIIKITNMPTSLSEVSVMAFMIN